MPWSTTGQSLRGPTGPQGPTGPAGSNASATTDASALTSGLLPADRLPAASSPIRFGTVAASLTSDAARAQGGNIANITATGNITINAPTNPTDGQIMRYRVVASGAQRTVTFAGIVASTGLTLGPFTVLRGAVLIAALEYVSIRQTSAGVAAPSWVLTAATVSG